MDGYEYHLLSAIRAHFFAQVLTDNVCSKCGKVPLMRSPSGPILYFCANCDGSPSRASQHGPQPSQSAASSHRTATIPSPRSGSSYDSSSHGASRPSTPPTELYSQLSFDAEDTEEILRRREQSDHASTEIGKLLLKGWTMLADECPNSQCYGIPLVRPPKGDKDPRKVCLRSIPLSIVINCEIGMCHLPWCVC